MKSSSFVGLLLLATTLLVAGCARSSNAEVERARFEADEAYALAEQAREELAAAKAVAVPARDELAEPKVLPKSTSPRIWRDTEAEELCRTLGIEADCFRYEGGWVAGWIEVEMDGKKTHWGEDEEIHRTAAVLRIKEAAVAKPTGTLIWVRRWEGTNEAWDLAFKSKVATSKGEASSNSKITLAPPNGPPQPTLMGKQRLLQGEAAIELKEGAEVTLVTLLSLGERDDQVTRTVKLKCKLLK